MFPSPLALQLCFIVWAGVGGDRRDLDGIPAYRVSSSHRGLWHGKAAKHELSVGGGDLRHSS